jgi:hypothetical protein
MIAHWASASVGESTTGIPIKVSNLFASLLCVCVTFTVLLANFAIASVSPDSSAAFFPSSASSLLARRFASWM